MAALSESLILSIWCQILDCRLLLTTWKYVGLTHLSLDQDSGYIAGYDFKNIFIDATCKFTWDEAIIVSF